MSLFSSPSGSPHLPAAQRSKKVRWRRLSLLSVLFFTASNIKNLISFAIYMVPAVAVGLNNTDLAHADWFWPAVAILVLVMACSGVIDYLFYQFRVSEQHLEIREGMLNRRHLNLPFWRIQSVKIEQPVYFRLTPYVVMILDTAGSASDEARLVAVPMAYAQSLKQQILLEREQHLKAQQSDSHSDQDRAAAEIPPEILLNTRSLKDLVIHGITNNRVWILLGALAPFFDELGDFIYFWLDSLGIELDAFLQHGSYTWWQLGLYGLSLFLLVMTVLALLSVVSSLLTYYGYTLSKQQDRYIRRSGLLSTQEVSLKLSRLQMVTAKQDWLDRILRRANLFFEQNLTGKDPNQELMAAHKLVVPSVTNDEVKALIADALPGNHLYSANYNPVQRRFIWHQYLVWLLPTSVTLIIATLVFGLWQGTALCFALSLIAALLVQFRYRRWGVAWDQRFVYVRSGMVGVDRRCFELFKVQQAQIRQSYWMKARQLASVKLVLASGSVTVPYLREDQAYELVDLALYKVEHSRKSWM